MKFATCSAGPNLALVKYWGKIPGDERNIPATTSIGLTLSTLRTYTRVSIGSERELGKSSMTVNGKPEAVPQDFLLGLRALISASRAAAPQAFHDIPANAEISVSSTNNFSTSAGLASSASGYAALAAAAFAAALKPDLRREWLNSLSGRTEAESPATSGTVPGLPTAEQLSALARLGSGSASRSVFAGFSRFSAGQPNASQIFDENHWPDLRVLVLTLSSRRKEVSSRAAMEAARLTSPFYKTWIEESAKLADQAELAIRRRDIAALGPVMRSSYLQMFGTMFSSQPPLLYWLPGTVAVLQKLEELRSAGMQAWETMDAGPQVKIFMPESQASAIEAALAQAFPEVPRTLCGPGSGVRLEESESG